MHLKHKWSSWRPFIDTSDRDWIIEQVQKILDGRGLEANNVTVVDIDQRHCLLCGKRQLREVKP